MLKWEIVFRLSIFAASFQCILVVVDVSAFENVIRLEIEPDVVQLGSDAFLTCSYHILKDTPLYCVKWYRGNHEFYRYTPKEHPNTKIFPFDGIHVDLKQSTEHQVVLTKIGFNLSGNFTCEVTTDAPTFSTMAASKEMLVVVLPKQVPNLVTNKIVYEAGDLLMANCSSVPSRPAATLQFQLNNAEVCEKCATRKHSSVRQLWWSEAQLELPLFPSHFKDGQLTLRCVSKVLDGYELVSEVRLYHDHVDSIPARDMASTASFWAKNQIRVDVHIEDVRLPGNVDRSETVKTQWSATSKMQNAKVRPNEPSRAYNNCWEMATTLNNARSPAGKTTVTDEDYIEVISVEDLEESRSSNCLEKAATTLSGAAQPVVQTTTLADVTEIITVDNSTKRNISDTVFVKWFGNYVAYLKWSQTFRVLLYNFIRAVTMIVILTEAYFYVNTPSLLYQFGVGFGSEISMLWFIWFTLICDSSTTKFCDNTLSYWRNASLTNEQLKKGSMELTFNVKQTIIFIILVYLSYVACLPFFGKTHLVFYTANLMYMQNWGVFYYVLLYLLTGLAMLITMNAVNVLVSFIIHITNCRMILELASGCLTEDEQQFEDLEPGELLRNEEYQKHVYKNIRNAAILHRDALRLNVEFNRMWGWLIPIFISVMLQGAAFTLNTFMHYDVIAHVGWQYYIVQIMSCSIGIFLVETTCQRLTNKSEEFYNALLASCKLDSWNAKNRQLYQMLLLGNTPELFTIKFKRNIFFNHIGLTKYVHLMFTIFNILKVVYGVDVGDLLN